MRQSAEEKNLYSNVLMLSIDDEKICTIADKKANWYIKKELAEELDASNTEYNRIIKLKFKNKGKVEDLTQVLENKCVVCGVTENLTKHHVIPYFLRKHFPVKYKEHQHRWCVLVCDQHHNEADIYAGELYKDELKKHDEYIRELVKKEREKFGKRLIKKMGGIKKTQELFRNQFLKINPKHLPDEFLKDKK